MCSTEGVVEIPRPWLAGHRRTANVNPLAGATDLSEYHGDSPFWSLEKFQTKSFFLVDSSTSTTISTSS